MIGLPPVGLVVVARGARSLGGRLRRRRDGSWLTRDGPGRNGGKNRAVCHHVSSLLIWASVPSPKEGICRQASRGYQGWVRAGYVPLELPLGRPLSSRRPLLGPQQAGLLLELLCDLRAGEVAADRGLRDAVPSPIPAAM